MKRICLLSCILFLSKVGFCFQTISSPEGHLQYINYTSTTSAGAQFILNQSTLQSGAVFNVSSGTVQDQFNTNGNDNFNNATGIDFVNASTLTITGLYIDLVGSGTVTGNFYVNGATVLTGGPSNSVTLNVLNPAVSGY